MYRNADGRLHRDDGPAVEYANGRRFWYQNGLLHRVDGPALELGDHGVYWYYKNKCYTDIFLFCDAANIVGRERTLFILRHSDSFFA